MRGLIRRGLSLHLVVGKIINSKRRGCEKVTLEISTAIIISVLSLGFSVFFAFKNNKRSDTKDIEERVKSDTRINMKLDNISNTMSELKEEVTSLRDIITAHNERIIRLEQSTKSAHHRLDFLEDKLGVNFRRECKGEER